MEHRDLFPARTTSAAETCALGRDLSERLRPGDVVALYGPLGAGKTALTMGLAEGLGVDPREVTSPTYTILHEYLSGRIPVFHFDAYRIERLEELYDLGYEEYVDREGISVVEWADRVEALIPHHALRLRLDHADGDARTIRRLESDTYHPA